MFKGFTTLVLLKPVSVAKSLFSCKWINLINVVYVYMFMLVYCCYTLSEVAQSFTVVVATLLQMLSDFENLQHMFFLLKLLFIVFKPCYHIDVVVYWDHCSSVVWMLLSLLLSSLLFLMFCLLRPLLFSGLDVVVTAVVIVVVSDVVVYWRPFLWSSSMSKSHSTLV